SGCNKDGQALAAGAHVPERISINKTHDRHMLMFLNHRGLNFFDIDQIGGIVPGVAGGAVSSFLTVVASFLHSLERKIRERICADVLANFFHRVVGGDEFFLAWSIHSIETWRDRWRTGDPQMNFGCTRAAYHTYDFFAGCSAHNRVIDQHHALALEQAAHWIQFEPHTKIAHRLLRLDEGAADVVVANQAETQWDTALGCVAHGGRHT